MRYRNRKEPVYTIWNPRRFPAGPRSPRVAKRTEATIQAEFYHWCRVIGLRCELETSTPVGYLDNAIFSNDGQYLLCIVECKKESDKPMVETDQIRRYKRIGVPVYGLNQFDKAERLARTILSKNYRGLHLTTLFEMEKEVGIHSKRKRKVRVDPDLNFRPDPSYYV